MDPDDRRRADRVADHAFRARPAGGARLVVDAMTRRADVINSWFEWAGSLFIAASIVQVLHDKQVYGISWLTILFFSVWGYWNLYYYRAVSHMRSLIAAGFLALTNSVYLGLLLYYS